MSLPPSCLVRAFLLFASLLAGCGGGNGDSPAAPRADEYGDGSRVSQLVSDATWLNPDDKDSQRCKPPPDRSAYITGVTIVAIDRFDETGKGAIGNYYVEDSSADPGPHAGLTVFRPSFSPPDLRLAQGDVVDMSGTLTEFLGPSVGKFGSCRTLPELSGTLSFRFENSPVRPKTIPLSELKSYPSARKYIGMLVRVEGVAIAGDPASSSGRYAATINVGVGVPQSDVPSIDNELYDLEKAGPPLADGTRFRAVTGVVTYFYGFKIAPRSPADFEP